MWVQYKKTFAKTQAVIAVAAFGTYVCFGHAMARSLVFFVMMQLGSVAGVAWGMRLKRKVDGRL